MYYYTLLFALEGLPVCKPEAIGRGIAKRVRLQEEFHTIDLLSVQIDKNKIVFASHLLKTGLKPVSLNILL